jgi:hypothetical protein
VSGYLAPLTRPELDALLAAAEHSSVKARVAMSITPLHQERVYQAAGVAADCLRMWMDALEESIRRMWDGDAAVDRLFDLGGDNG